MNYLIKYSLDRKIYNCRVFFNEKRVFCEPLNVKYQIWRQLRYLEPFEKILFIRFIFLGCLTVEFR